MDEDSVIDPIVAELVKLRRDQVQLRVELEQAKRFILYLAERVFAQHELLQKRAEKPCHAYKT